MENKNNVFLNLEAMIYDKVREEAFQEIKEEEKVDLTLEGDSISVNGFMGIIDLNRKLKLKIDNKITKKIYKLYEFIENL